MLEVTGERLIPERQREELVYAEHLARYRFAAQFAADARVLDAACGEGYGTAMLAAAGASAVTGVDVDRSTLAAAREKYGHQFTYGDVSNLPFEHNSFDLVVSFETIEHVDDPSAAVAEFRRVLRPEGRLVISTPNRDEYLVDNEFHKQEFDNDEYLALLKRHFGEVALLFQQNWLVSTVLGPQQHKLADTGSLLDVDLVKVAGCAPGRELYTIAICGRVPGSVSETGVITGVYEAHKMAERVTETERHLFAWVERSEEAERVTEAWLARAREAERQLAEARKTIARIESSPSWKLTRPLRSLKSLTRRPSK